MARIKFLTVFAASLIALAPMHAFAQGTDSVAVRDRPRPDYDPLGLRFGGFDVNASVDLSVMRTDNLFATETGEQEDFVYHVTPRVSAGSHWSRHGLYAAAGADFKSHRDFSNEDADTGYVRVGGRLDVGAATHVTADAGWAHEVESRTDPDASVVGDPIEYDRSDVVVGVQHEFNRFRVSVAGGHMEYDYDAPENFRDSEEDNVTGRIEAEITPRVAALVQARFDDRTYKNQPPLSSEGRTYLAGVSINFTELMRGEIAVGQFSRDYDSGASVDGLATAANLEWYVTRLTTINLSANRDAQDQGGTAAAPYVSSRYGIRVDHELLRNLILSAGGEVGRREYEVIDRTDEFSNANLEAEYLLNRRVALRGRLSHIEVDSTGADAYRTFDVNEAMVGVSLRL